MKKYIEQIDKNHHNYNEIVKWLTVNLKNHVKKELENEGEIEHILDYLQSDKAPKELRGLQYHAAANNAHRWVQAMNKKGRNIPETDADVEVVIDFEDGFKLVQLIKPNAYKREGALMAHCVASYADKACKVFSLRDSKNVPHCTIEVNENETGINQIKGKGNGSIHPRYVSYVIKVIEHLGLPVRDSEMSNLGYIKISPELLERMRTDLVNLQFLNLHDKIYLYSYNDFRRKGQ